MSQTYQNFNQQPTYQKQNSFHHQNKLPTDMTGGEGQGYQKPYYKKQWTQNNNYGNRQNNNYKSYDGPKKQWGNRDYNNRGSYQGNNKYQNKFENNHHQNNQYANSANNVNQSQSQYQPVAATSQESAFTNATPFVPKAASAGASTD